MEVRTLPGMGVARKLALGKGLPTGIGDPVTNKDTLTPRHSSRAAYSPP